MLFFDRKKPQAKKPPVKEPAPVVKEKRTIGPGKVQPLGATVVEGGVNFAIQSHGATSCTLVLFPLGKNTPIREIPLPAEYKVGDVWNIFVPDLDWKNLEYGYRMDGPFQPEKGLRFDPTKILLDPYAKSVAGKDTWGCGGDFVYHGRIVQDNFDWKGDKAPGYDITQLVMYELHTRFFTQHPSSGVNAPGTFRGVQEKIPYLKRLGVNAVELLPIYQFDETLHRRKVGGKTLLESWGYNTIGFFAPTSAYFSARQPGEEGNELKELIRQLHANGMEVFLDVVFNHTGEGNGDGPQFSFKGLDNNVYYLLGPDGSYHNYSGCGNTVNCNHPVVQQMILDCLRYWVIQYHIDGFRFDLASVLSRGEDGKPLDNPPVLRAIALDPILSKTKLVGEVWDAVGLYQIGKFPANGRWAEWNGQYRDTIRGYLKGDAWESAAALKRITGSLDLYSQGGYMGCASSVNLITCHDGFTLYDIYAYNQKHNQVNGWNNDDGTNDNRSWNCGVEGETENPLINSLRHKMIRNAATVLMCSRGSALFLAGDEFGNSQGGNNNCYCQDNDLSYLDWKMLTKNQDIFHFFQYMIQFRYRHPVVQAPLEKNVEGMEQAACYGADGKKAPEANAQITQVCFAGVTPDGAKDIVCLAMNVHWEPAKITLPALPKGLEWRLEVDTGAENGRYTHAPGRQSPVEGAYSMEGRTTAVFVAAEKPETTEAPKTKGAS